MGHGHGSTASASTSRRWSTSPPGAKRPPPPVPPEISAARALMLEQREATIGSTTGTPRCPSVLPQPRGPDNALDGRPSLRLVPIGPPEIGQRLGHLDGGPNRPPGPHAAPPDFAPVPSIGPGPAPRTGSGGDAPAPTRMAENPGAMYGGIQAMQPRQQTAGGAGAPHARQDMDPGARRVESSPAAPTLVDSPDVGSTQLDDDGDDNMT